MSSEINQEDLKPPKVGRPDGLAKNLKGAPEDVRMGVLMWWSVCSMQALYAIVQFVANIVDPSALRAQVKAQSETLGGFGGFGESVAEQDSATSASTLNVSMLVWMLVIIAICAYLTWRAGRGGPHSRMFLNVGSLYLALQAALLLFGTTNSTMPVAFVLILGILSILSGVTAVLGMWFMSRPENRTWLGIPDVAEVEKYAAAVQRRRKEEKDEKQAKKQAQEREKKEQEARDQDSPAAPNGQNPNGQNHGQNHGQNGEPPNSPSNPYRR